jgi:hypothetical protein
MKKKNKNVPAPSKLNLLRQICNFIPEFLVAKLARETGVEDKVRSFSAWSHLLALLYAQLTHSIGLNDVCDALSLQSGPLSSLRGATPPSRNNLSHSSKVRPATMAEKLFWAVFEHLGNLSPRFVSGKVQAHDSSGGLDDYSVDRLVPGLGTPSTAQSGRQMSSAA